jgi:hypothetical protein
MFDSTTTTTSDYELASNDDSHYEQPAFYMSHTHDLQSSMIKTSNDVQDSVSSANIKLLSFSCKNNKTSGTFFQDFEKDIDIYLVQEH